MKKKILLKNKNENPFFSSNTQENYGIVKKNDIPPFLNSLENLSSIQENPFPNSRCYIRKTPSYWGYDLLGFVFSVKKHEDQDPPSSSAERLVEEENMERKLVSSLDQLENQTNHSSTQRLTRKRSAEQNIEFISLPEEKQTNIKKENINENQVIEKKEPKRTPSNEESELHSFYPFFKARRRKNKHTKSIESMAPNKKRVLLLFHTDKEYLNSKDLTPQPENIQEFKKILKPDQSLGKVIKNFIDDEDTASNLEKKIEENITWRMDSIFSDLYSYKEKGPLRYEKFKKEVKRFILEIFLEKEIQKKFCILDDIYESIACHFLLRIITPLNLIYSNRTVYFLKKDLNEQISLGKRKLKCKIFDSFYTSMSMNQYSYEEWLNKNYVTTEKIRNEISYYSSLNTKTDTKITRVIFDTSMMEFRTANIAEKEKLLINSHLITFEKENYYSYLKEMYNLIKKE